MKNVKLGLIWTLASGLILAGCGQVANDLPTTDEAPDVVASTTDTNEPAIADCNTVMPEHLLTTTLIKDDANIEVRVEENYSMGNGITTVRCEYQWDQEGLKFNKGRLVIMYFASEASPERTADDAYTKFMKEASIGAEESPIESINDLGDMAEWTVDSGTLVFKKGNNAIYMQFKRGANTQDNVEFVKEVGAHIISQL